MKVVLPEDYKDNFTLSDLKAAKKVIKFQKEEDSSTIEDYAKMAIYEALRDGKDYLDRVLEAKADVRKNNRVWELFGEDTKDMDIWITAIAKTVWGFIEIGAYLSDIYETGNKDYKTTMWIDHYMKRPEYI